MVEFTPEKSKKIALARLDLLNQWKEFRRKSDNKLQADYDFVNLHNTSNSYLFAILGKISSFDFIVVVWCWAYFNRHFY